MNKELFQPNNLGENKSKTNFVFNRIEKIEKYYPKTKNIPYESINIENKLPKLKEISLTEQLKDFSDEEKKVLLKNLVALQLTDGCSGSCYFCYKGEIGKPKSAFSTDSIRDLFNKYGNEIGAWFGFTLYDKSDPFEKEKFTEVFKIIKKTNKKNILLTTSLPKGTEDNFIEFANYYFTNQPEENHSFRISLMGKNTFRTKFVLQKLIEDLYKKDLSYEKIDQLLHDKITIEKRSKKEIIKFIGKKINNEMSTKNLRSCADLEGVVISPGKVQAMVMVAPTSFDPSGERYLDIKPGEVFKKTPRPLEKYGFNSFPYRSYLLERTKYKNITILPPMLDSDGELYEPYDNRAENLCLFASRESFTMSNVLDDVADLDWAKSKYNYHEQEIADFLTVSLTNLEKRLKFVYKITEMINSILKREDNGQQKEKLVFFNNLFKLYKDKSLILLLYADKTKDIKKIIKCAQILQTKGIADKDILPETFQKFDNFKLN